MSAVTNGGIDDDKYHLDEFTVLDHHSLDNAQKCFKAWKEAGTTSERVTLEHSLTGVLRKYLDDTTTFATRGYIPLEVTVTVIKDSVELVGDEFIRRENAERLRVSERLNKTR